MSMGKRRVEQQPELWVVSADLPRSPGHAFYDRLNGILAEAGFDRFVEDLCRPHYAQDVGRESIPPGVYFRMLFVGYFEELDSQRAIAWRCSDSLSLRSFLGIPLEERTPDHSSLTRIRKRLPREVYDRVFIHVLSIAQEKGLLKGKTVGVDSTTLEANAAMKSIVRKDTGEGYTEYLKRLLAEQGVENPTDEDARRFDRDRKNKGSNQEWQSPSDPDSRIAKMKDHRTHLAYKAEHVVDLESEFVVAAPVYRADQSDASTMAESLIAAQVNLVLSGSEQDIEEAAADKGYHKTETIFDCERMGCRTYVPEPKRKKRTWHDKPAGHERAFRNNRRRVRGQKSKRLQRRRSEVVERSFAHVCETGGGRRTQLRGLEQVAKRYAAHVAAHNLGVLIRKLFGAGKPRRLQGSGLGVSGLLGLLASLAAALGAYWSSARPVRSLPGCGAQRSSDGLFSWRKRERRPSSTGC